MLRHVDAFAGRATTWLVRLGAVVLAVMMAMTFVDVVGRYALNSPLVGAVEMTELLMGTIVYLGIGLTTQMRGHITVDLVTAHVPPRVRAALGLFADLASITFAAILSWELWRRAQRTFDDNLITQVWEVPVYPAAYVMAAGSSVMVIVLLVQVLESLTRVASPEHGSRD